jgi:hypothetical protein
MKLTDVKQEIVSLKEQTETLLGLPHHSPQKRNYLLGKKHTLSHLQALLNKIEKKQTDKVSA